MSTISPLKWICLSLAALSLCSCTAQRYVPMAGQRVVRAKKSCMIVSVKPSASLAITSLGISEGKARFVVSIANRTGHPLVVGPGQISASNEAGLKVKIFSAQEMEFEAVNRAGKMVSAVESNAGGQLAQAGLACAPPVVAERIGARASDRLAMIGERLEKDLEDTGRVLRIGAVAPHKIHSALLATKVYRAICFQFIIANEIHNGNFIIERVKPTH